MQSDQSDKFDVKKVLETWTLQAGYPVVTFIRDYQSNRMTITQERFFLKPFRNSIKQVVHSCLSTWTVPLTFTSSRSINWSPKTKLWLNQNETTKTVQLDDYVSSMGNQDWLIANLKQVAFYRVNYDLQNWNNIFKQLIDDHKKIHLTNRAQIIDDLFNLARANYVDYSVALNSTKYLKNEVQYICWKTAFDSFKFIIKMIEKTDAYGDWKVVFLKTYILKYFKLFSLEIYFKLN